MKLLWPKARKFLASILDDIAVYIATVIGVLLSKFGTPLLLWYSDNLKPNFDGVTWIQLALAAGIGLFAMFRSEQRGMEEPKNRVAKDARIKARIAAGFMAGLGCAQIMSIVTDALKGAA